MTVSPIPVAPEPPDGRQRASRTRRGEHAGGAGAQRRVAPQHAAATAQVLHGQAPAAGSDRQHGPGQPGAAGTGAGPRLRHVTDHGPAGPGRTGGGGPRCCAGRARARSWPSRRWRSRSSWPATPKACARTACTRRPGSWRSATWRPTRTWPPGSASGPAPARCASTGCGWPTGSLCRWTPRTCRPAASPGCASSSTGTARCTRRSSSAYGVRLTEAEETIETVLADPHNADLLAVDVGLPLLLLSRHAVDVTGETVEWAQSWYRGDRYKFVTRLRRLAEWACSSSAAPARGWARP